MYENYKGLGIERRGKVLVVTINNPPMNSMTRLMHDELARIFFDINRDPDTAVVVLTGAGDRAFSAGGEGPVAGGDVKGMVERIDNQDHATWIKGNWEAKEIVSGLMRLERPLIARINGHATGMGATLAVLSDFSYMVKGVKIADTHVKVGLTAGDGGALIWPLLVGFNRAKRYLLTGDSLDSTEAVDIGLITAEAEDIADLDRQVYEMADRLAAGATYAINGTKMSINMVMRKMVEGLMEAHLGWETYSYLTKDHREGAASFLEKRDPDFTGS